MIVGQRGNNPKEPRIILAFAKHSTDVAALCWLTELVPPGLAWASVHDSACSSRARQDF